LLKEESAGETGTLWLRINFLKLAPFAQEWVAPFGQEYLASFG
jgi:hypothetical protein